ncbi:unnamed protein product [Phytophthora fragariaefolia]|uniref:Unnamed protein product n=1 Tax=Phytophthora fragariaefolia TaxID=1490495 RepID=A0A9W6Y300_9STRA|nr:unnamed protein product [Phytophthora fragariaefolia]
MDNLKLMKLATIIDSSANYWSGLVSSMVDDDVASAEIAKQIAALRPLVQGSRGVMAYLVRDLQSERGSSGRSRSRDRDAAEDETGKGDDERSYWARKKAEKTRQLWEKLHSEGTVSVENAPDFSGEDSGDDDVKPTKLQSPRRSKKKYKKDNKQKKQKKHKRKSDEKEKRRRTCS